MSNVINGYDFFFDQQKCAAKLWLFFYFMGLAMFYEEEGKIDYKEYDLFYLPIELYA